MSEILFFLDSFCSMLVLLNLLNKGGLNLPFGCHSGRSEESLRFLPSVEMTITDKILRCGYLLFPAGRGRG